MMTSLLVRTLSVVIHARHEGTSCLPSWDGTFFAKLQVSQTGSSLHSIVHSHYTHPRYSKTEANNEPRVSGSNEAVCTAGNSGLAEKKKKTPRMLRELESTLGDYWKGSGKRGSRRRQ